MSKKENKVFCKVKKKTSLMDHSVWFLVILCVCAYLGVFFLINVRGLEEFCNSDVYADMQVAKMMWEQKTLFPDGWTFGNQYYIIATPVLAAIFYGLTGNINIAMILATSVMTVCIFLSLLWLLRAFTNNLLHFFVCCLILLASPIAPYGPYSLHSMLFYTQASFYSCYLITMFVVFGDYVRSYKTAKTRIVSLVFSLILCFTTGMQSLRQTVIMVLPIIACELFKMLRRLLGKKKLLEGQNVGSLIRAISYGLANGLGAILIRRLNVSSAPIYGEMKLITLNQLSERIEPIWGALSEITSLNVILQGDARFALVMIVAMFIFISFAATTIWIREIKDEESGLKLCWLLCFVGMIGVIMSTVVLNITLRSIYLFTWFPFVAFSALMLIEKLPDLLKKGMILLICVTSLAGFMESYLPYANLILFRQNTDASELCQWAEESGYEYIYGEYWGTGPQITVYSDGKIEAGCWHTAKEIFEIEPSNTPQNIYGAEENEKAIYVFTAEDEEAGLLAALEQGVEMEKINEFGKYYVYTSPIPLMYQ